MIEGTTLEDIEYLLESYFDDRTAALKQENIWSKKQQGQLDTILEDIGSGWYHIIGNAQHVEDASSLSLSVLQDGWNDYRLAAGADSILFSSYLQRPIDCDEIIPSFTETVFVKHVEEIMDAISGGDLPEDPVILLQSAPVVAIEASILGAVVVLVKILSTKPIKNIVHRAVYLIALDHCKNNTGQKEECNVEQITEWLTKLADVSKKDDESLRHFKSNTRINAQAALREIRDTNQWAIDACQEAAKSLKKAGYLQQTERDGKTYFRVKYHT